MVMDFVKMLCRNYNNADCSRQETVKEFYGQKHIKSLTKHLTFLSKMRQEYSDMNRAEISIWECCEILNTIVDDSDPDLDEPQIQHALQSADSRRHQKGLP
ncbi:Myo-inositol oxygenase 2, putative [Theobroma cacao]|uniref:Inositol oxygenase n=1 Tax=Theobroma cacao TaxID=3641 RepID=A0A061GM13_THECC|nr:Myo-inositol oxygenase 2, putative [Theobroma cacao]